MLPSDGTSVYRILLEPTRISSSELISFFKLKNICNHSSSSFSPNPSSNNHNRFLSVRKNGLITIPIRFASSGNLPAHKKITLPALSPTMETGTLRSWSKQEGEKVAEGKTDGHDQSILDFDFDLQVIY